jgi:DNA-binding transcriptional LysR family regulator
VVHGLTALVAVAEAGSITEAVRRMGISKSMLSERLADLEHSLGARLPQRTTRKVSVTEDGSAYLERARRIVRDASEAARHGTPKPPADLHARNAIL